MKGILTIDIGTSSMRAILYDEQGRAGPSDQRANPPQYHGDGRVEQDPRTWLLLLGQLARSAAEEAKRRSLHIACIALTSPRSSVIPVDAAGSAFHPAIMWQDVRTVSLASELASHDALVRSRTGSRISPVMSAIKMLWLRRERPELFSRTFKMLGVHDFALHALTGRFVTDPSVASRTNLLDLETRQWDSELAGIFGVDLARLSELVPPGSVVGGLRADFARDSGLASGTPVVSAGGDQQCAALGLGLFSGDRAVSNNGTGSYLLGHLSAPWVDPEARTTCSVSALPGAYIVEAALPTSGTLYRWFKENLWNGPSPIEDPFGAMNDEAEAAGPGAHGVSLLPHFSGSGTPGWNSAARGLFAGLSAGTKRGDLARAILEGMAPNYPAAFERAIAGLKVDRFEPDAPAHARYAESRRRNRALYTAVSSVSGREGMET
jgi:glycerol kinase